MRNFLKITDVCDFQGGSQPPKNEWSDTLKDGYVRMLQIRDFTQDREDKQEFVKITNSTKTCNEDDVLIARYGASIGKILTGLSGAYNVAIMKTIPNEQLIDKRYLLHFLKSDSFQIHIRNVGSRAAQAGFNKTDLEKVILNLPTIEEQKKIAQVLDKADEIRAKKKLANDKLDEFLKSTFISMFGDPIRNEKKFGIKCLKDFYIDEKAVKCGPFGSALKKHEYTETGIPVWNMDNILPNSEFDRKPNLCISEKKYRELESYNVKANDIIISRAGTVGKMCVVANIEGNSIISTNLIRLRLKQENLLPIWFVKLLEYQGSRVCRLKTGAEGAFTHMNTGVLDSIYFPYPPRELQNKFAKIVEKVEAQKQKNKLVIEQMNNLFNSLSQRAFKGDISA